METEKLTNQNDLTDYEVTHQFYIAGVKFHQLHSVIDLIEEGSYLRLVPEPTNKFDPNAVRIEYATFEKEAMLGYVPKVSSAAVSAVIAVGKKLECVVISLNPSEKPWKQCKVEIREVKE